MAKPGRWSMKKLPIGIQTFEKIIEEKQKITDALELIREYSKQLNSLADDTQQRLIGKG